MSKHLFVIIGLLALSGCSSQRFDCPYKEGVRCIRLSEVDKRIDAGQLSSTSFKPLKTLSPQPVPESPLRATEEVLTVWIAPYQTGDGTYHEEKRLHFVAKPSDWLNTPLDIKEKSDETPQVE